MKIHERKNRKLRKNSVEMEKLTLYGGFDEIISRLWIQNREEKKCTHCAVDRF